MKEAVRKAQNGSSNRKLHRGTFIEGFIDDYARVRLIIALVSLPLMVGLFFGGVDRMVVGLTALGLGVMAIHAGWNLRVGFRTPRLALALDMTVTNAAAMASVIPAITAATFGFWCVLITFVTQGRSRQVFYAYAVGWYLFLVSLATPAQDIATTASIVVATAFTVLILLTVSRRSLMLEGQRSQLLGSVSHELRNQLTGVMGMIDLVLDEDGLPIPDETRDLIGLARREAADATGIIEDLLTASRMESNVFEVASEPVDLDLEVAKVVDHYPAEGMTIRHTGPRSGVVALADQVRLRQVLRNLLSNAVRYGGKSIGVSVHPDGTNVHVRVADDGPGVPAGEEETIFLPYRRASTRRHKSSIGLGLWISRRLARAMGGNLTYSRVGTETVFELTLPVYAPPVTALPTPVALVEGT
jgi:signal transduction histidine kinase